MSDGMCFRKDVIKFRRGQAESRSVLLLFMNEGETWLKSRRLFFHTGEKKQVLFLNFLYIFIQSLRTRSNKLLDYNYYMPPQPQYKYSLFSMSLQVLPL